MLQHSALGEIPFRGTRFGKAPINLRLRFVRRTGLLALLAIPLALAFAAPAHAATGDLAQKPGTAGCISESGAAGTYPDYKLGGCTDGLALSGASSIVSSPDGKNAYVGSGRAVAVFDRNASTGELTQKTGTEGCTASTNDPEVASCALGDGIDDYAGKIAISPDGKNVYFPSGNGVAIFNRNTSTGVLTQTGDASGCVTEEGKGAHPVYRPGECQDGRALAGAHLIAIPPDGKTVYVATGGVAPSGAGVGIAIFDRNTATGALSQKTGTAGCVVEDNTLAAVTTCAEGRALSKPASITISPDGDGKSLYLASQSGTIAVFDRDRLSGNISQKTGQAGCVAEDNTVPAVASCADGRALGRVSSLVTSVDDLGKSVYAASDEGIAVFDRDTNTGVLTQKAGTSGCVNTLAAVTTCAEGRELSYGYEAAVAVSPDGRSLYFTNYFGAIAIFDRAVNSDIGALTQKPGAAGCISNDGISIDFPSGPSGACVAGKAIYGAWALAISPGGENLYSTAEQDGQGAVAVFDRELLDTTPPDTTIESGPTGTIDTPEARFTFSGNPAGDTAKIQCRIDSSSFSDCSSPNAIVLDDGPHTASFRAEDAAGNQDPTPATRTFTVDTTAPETTIDSGPSGTINTDKATFTFSGTPASDTANVQCRIEIFQFSDCSSPKTFSGLADGPHTVTFRAEDAIGNQDMTPATRDFTVDTTPSDTKVQGAATTKKSQQQTGKDIEIQTVIKLKEPVEIEPRKCVEDFLPWINWCENADMTVDLGGSMIIVGIPMYTPCFPTGSVLRYSKECHERFPGTDFTSIRSSSAVAPIASSSAAGKCRSLADPCVFGRKITLTIRPEKKKSERKMVKKLKKGKKVMVKETLILSDIAGNTKTKKLKVELTRKLKKKKR